ncbi:MAG: DUF3298 domain-containing protein [Terracidiphilus sp.]|jgi:uncharacterized protein
MKNTILIAILLTVLISASYCHAQAKNGPSFDCTKASNVVEKTICASSTLSQMDRKLSESYRASLALLSEEGKVSFQNGQRQWIKVTREVCDRTPFPKLPYMPTTEQCIEKHYRERLEQLQDAVHDYGGIKIRRVDTFEAHRSESKSEYSGVGVGFDTTSISYPQIDAPASSLEVLWNKKMADMANSVVGMNQEGGDNDYAFDFTILSVSQRLISVDVDGGFYAHGTPHGHYSSTRVNWLLNKGREMQADDVFDKTKPWQEAVLKYCFDDLSKHDDYWVNPKNNQVVINLGNMPLETSRWAFQKDGLRIQFDPYEIAAYAFGSPKVLIPWDVLRQYLVTDPPIAKELYEQGIK